MCILYIYRWTSHKTSFITLKIRRKCFYSIKMVCKNDVFNCHLKQCRSHYRWEMIFTSIVQWTILPVSIKICMYVLIITSANTVHHSYSERSNLHTRKEKKNYIVSKLLNIMVFVLKCTTILKTQWCLWR